MRAYCLISALTKSCIKSTGCPIKFELQIVNTNSGHTYMKNVFIAYLKLKVD